MNAEPTSSVEQRNEGRDQAWKEWTGVGLIVNADPPAYRYEINDLKDGCREKLLDFFIALRKEIEDEDFQRI